MEKERFSVLSHYSEGDWVTYYDEGEELSYHDVLVILNNLSDENDDLKKDKVKLLDEYLSLMRKYLMLKFNVG